MRSFFAAVLTPLCLATAVMALPADAAAPNAGSFNAGPRVEGTPTANDPHVDFGSTPTDQQLAAALESIETMTERQSAPIELPEGVELAAGAGDYVVEYVDAIPGTHQAVIDAVMTEWAEAVDMNSGGIHVKVYFQPLGGSALAGANNYSVPVTENGVTFTVTTALLNAQAGADQYVGLEDIGVYINSNVNWDTQTSGTPSGAQYSLYTTLLHEIGHGLGFSGNVDPSTNPGDLLTAFDQRLHHGPEANGGGAPASPIYTVTDPQVQTGQAWFQNLDGTWERIYDPVGAYENGSSMSHFDEATYPGFTGTAGALMSPVLFNGEAIYDIDNVVLGAMEATGWVVDRAPSTPTVASAQVNGGGVIISVDPNDTANAMPAANWIVSVSQGGTQFSATTVNATERTVTLSVFLPSGDYVVSVIGQGSGGQSAPATLSVTSNNLGSPNYDNCREAPVSPAFDTSDPTRASVYRLYCAYFLRYPDQAGYDYWYAEFSTGARSLSDISNFFSVSTEFVTLYGSLSNVEFIDLIYVNVLERAAEPTGYAFWINELDTGSRTRGDVMLFFSQSDEFKFKTGTT